VFCDELGGPDPPEAADPVVRATLQGGRHPTGTLHTLRHSAATLALTSGVPVHIVAARLGDNPTIMLSPYAHLLLSQTDWRPRGWRR
jgi:integrase